MKEYLNNKADGINDVVKMLSKEISIKQNEMKDSDKKEIDESILENLISIKNSTEEYMFALRNRAKKYSEDDGTTNIYYFKIKLNGKVVKGYIHGKSEKEASDKLIEKYDIYYEDILDMDETFILII